MRYKVNQKRKESSPYDALRARLINRGTNLRRWAKERHYKYTTVVSAAKGVRCGIKSVKIKNELEEFANG